MKPNLRYVLLGFLLATFLAAPLLAAEPSATLALTKDGLPVCRLVVFAEPTAQFLLNRSSELIAGSVKKWSGAELPRIVRPHDEKTLPSENAIVFTTLATLRKVAPHLLTKEEFRSISEISADGFACVPLTTGETQQLFVVSQTARGVFNGAVYLHDFCIDGTKENLTIDFSLIKRSPKLGGRPAYTLTIWGHEDQYTPADWEKVFESFSRDGIDRVYFWMSGHFPSKKYPQAYRTKTVENGKTFDTTVDTKIGTVAALAEIVRSAHRHGLKIYLGGGLGSWCGTVNITNEAKETMKTGPKEKSLCPSHPQVRKALVEYYWEMFAALPEADGVFIESADEVGACQCQACDRALDSLGSKQFGQAQLSLYQEMMDTVWRDYPHARGAYTIGYAEHVKDVAYYERIRQMSKDPRFEWMEARNSWSFPGPNAESQPAHNFSNQVMHWKQLYKVPLEEIVRTANRVGNENMYGLITSFEPGYSTGSFYKQIPYPTDILPYALTGFVYREATWDPTLTVEEMRKRVSQRFFGKDAPPYLANDLWRLREMIRARKGGKELTAIEEHIEEARATAGPKTTEGLDLMTRATQDLRAHLTKKK